MDKDLLNEIEAIVENQKQLSNYLFSIQDQLNEIKQQLNRLDNIGILLQEIEKNTR